MTLTIRRAWRSRLRRLRPATRGWLLPTVSLYWRRRTLSVSRVITRRARAAVTGATPHVTAVSVHQHFHLTPAKSRTAAIASQAVPRATAPAITRLERLSVRLASRAVAAAATLASSRITGPTTAARTGQPLAPGQAAPTHAPAAVIRQHLRSSRRPVFGRPVAGPATRRAASESAIAAPTWRRRMQVDSRQGSTVARRTPASGTGSVVALAAPRAIGTSPGAWRRQAAEARPIRGVPMEWRVPPSGITPRAPAAAVGVAPPGERAQAPGPSAPAQAERPADARPNGAREKAVLALDPSAIDRLADNVMQRIDRRIRIERERRGL